MISIHLNKFFNLKGLFILDLILKYKNDNFEIFSFYSFLYVLNSSN